LAEISDMQRHDYEIMERFGRADRRGENPGRPEALEFA
jgi:hypothetical protein